MTLGLRAGMQCVNYLAQKVGIGYANLLTGFDFYAYQGFHEGIPTTALTATSTAIVGMATETATTTLVERMIGGLGKAVNSVYQFFQSFGKN